ncbi:hypothetical protein ACH42_01970 [Endozoicomonas sp. (ex Bugula neritina AB1)]|nr:hypothetical protein ACH42_01970 [Endozoicomonas sp. (ex Bugula neritina AB1)]
MALDSDQNDLKSASNMKVIHHDPVRERRKQKALIILIMCFGVMAYWFGGIRNASESESLKQKNSQLQSDLSRLQSQNEKLASRVAVLERSGQIDRQATENVRTQVRELEEEKAEIIRNMAFYQSIIAPEDLREGVKLNAFDLVSGDAPNQFKLRMVVSQVSRSNNFLRGTLSASVKGLRDGKPETLSLLELSGEEERPVLGFRYFQSFPDDRGFMNLELPENFKPEKITINVRIRSGGAKSLEKVFDWQEELAANVGQDQRSD